MTTRRAMTLAVLAAGLFGAAAQAQYYIPPPAKNLPPGGGGAAAEALAAYLTPDGRLRSALDVRDEKRGFGTFAGTVYHIEPDGQWTVTEIYRQQPFPRAQGRLSPADLRKLAMALVQFDLLHLPNVGRPKVNPHVLTISFGGRASELTFGVDQVAVAPADPAQPADAVGRFGGIAGMVRALLHAPDPRGVPVGGR